MEFSLLQTQTTNVIVTPELREAISLLQYSTPELIQYIEELALENPFIELDEAKIAITESYGESYKKKTSHHTDASHLHINIAEHRTFHKYILEQIGCLKTSEKNRRILTFLALNIDENGFLDITNDEAAHKLKVPESKIKRNILTLQELEPCGVGARNVQECLSIQINRHYPEDHLTKKIVQNHLHLLANRNWKKLTEQLHVPISYIHASIKRIQSLQPRPCINHTYEQPTFLVPDIIISKENNRFTISLNDQYFPEIKLNPYYKKLLNNRLETTYLNEKYTQFKWLIRSLEQRKSTITKIIKVLIQHQNDFFQKGFTKLKPLTLREIAEEIDMHESTVSRSVKNKVIQTPVGTFMLNQLFSSKLSNHTGNDYSSTQVKLLIKEIINHENKQKPLSDQKIANMLHDLHTVVISRRTVAKYRESLGVSSTINRKMVD